VDGSGFLASSTVEWNGSSRPTTFVSANRLTAQLSGADIAALGMVSVTVRNPAPGGGVSNALLFKVAPGPAPGTGVVEMISEAADGSPSNGNTFTPPSVSATGRYVAFQSDGTNVVPGPASGFADIYVRDTCIGAPSGCTPSTIRVSVATDGTPANSSSGASSISADGRFVAFVSFATNLVPGDTNGQSDVFVRDTCFGAPAGCTPTTTRVSVATDGTQGNDGIFQSPMISADGRFVVFTSFASNLVPGKTTPFGEVYRRDTCVGATMGCAPATIRASVVFDDTEANQSSGNPSISADGHFAAFLSNATNLLAGGSNGNVQVFLARTGF
jgi:Tol biopolymer transport system component